MGCDPVVTGPQPHPPPRYTVPRARTHGPYTHGTHRHLPQRQPLPQLQRLRCRTPCRPQQRQRVPASRPLQGRHENRIPRRHVRWRRRRRRLRSHIRFPGYCRCCCRCRRRPDCRRRSACRPHATSDCATSTSTPGPSRTCSRACSRGRGRGGCSCAAEECLQCGCVAGVDEQVCQQGVHALQQHHTWQPPGLRVRM